MSVNLFLFSDFPTLFSYSHFSLSEIERRRIYSRKKLDFELHSIVDNSSVVTTATDLVIAADERSLGMGPLKPYRPPPAWKTTAMGFVPNATDYTQSRIHELVST